MNVWNSETDDKQDYSLMTASRTAMYLLGPAVLFCQTGLVVWYQPCDPERLRTCMLRGHSRTMRWEVKLPMLPKDKSMAQRLFAWQEIFCDWTKYDYSSTILDNFQFRNTPWHHEKSAVTPFSNSRSWWSSRFCWWDWGKWFLSSPFLLNADLRGHEKDALWGKILWSHWWR